MELYAGYGKNIVTALATINGSAVGIVATEKKALCHKCTAKAARFVRLCDAYSIPVVTLSLIHIFKSPFLLTMSSNGVGNTLEV